jgi:hypothetical protein
MWSAEPALSLSKGALACVNPLLDPRLYVFIAVKDFVPNPFPFPDFSHPPRHFFISIANKALPQINPWVSLA